MNNNGASAYSVAASFTTGGQIVGVINNLADVPSEFRLLQNYPNPFNPSTTIQYDLPITSHVTLTIHDVLGRVVTTLVDQVQPAERHSVQWNASAISSGVYFCHLSICSEDGSKTFLSLKKLLLMQ